MAQIGERTRSRICAVSLSDKGSNRQYVLSPMTV
jgi:hypothetical protein